MKAFTLLSKREWTWEKIILALFIFINISINTSTILRPDSVLSWYLIDDAFYYYELAENIANGQGVIFNNGVKTNGFHPLYALILVPLFKLFYPVGQFVPIRASLVILSLFSTLTAIPLYYIGKELCSKHLGLLIGVLWLFNPLISRITLSGVETPIQGFIIAVLMWYIITRVPKNQLTIRQSISIAVLLAVAFYTRLDSAIIALAVYLTLSLRAVWPPTSWRSAWNDIRPILVSGTVSLTLVLPWFIWSFLYVHRLTPVSGAANRLLQTRFNTFPELLLTPIFQILLSFKRYFIYDYVTLRQPIDLISSSGIIVYNGENYTPEVLGIGIILLLFGFLLAIILKLGNWRYYLGELDFVLLAVFMYFTYYIFYQFKFRIYYSVFSSIVLTILLAIGLVNLYEWGQKAQFRKVISVILIVLLFSGFLVSGFQYHNVKSDSGYTTKWEIGRYLDSEIPANQTIGSFNTGFYQYSTNNHDVINLDGVMNPISYQHLQHRTLTLYICNNIDYIVDPESQIRTRTNTDKIRMELVKEFGTRYRLYRIDGCRPSVGVTNSSSSMKPYGKYLKNYTELLRRGGPTPLVHARVVREGRGESPDKA